MSDVLNRKLTEIQNAYTNLKIRMAGDGIWVYQNTPLNTAYTKLFCHETGVEVPEEVETMTFDGLNVTVKTTEKQMVYNVYENRTMLINGVLTATDQAYSDGLCEIVTYSMASPAFMEDLIDDEDIFQLVYEDEYSANLICKLYTANLKYQSILQNFNSAINTMNDYCGKLDDEFVKYVNQPLLTSVKSIMNDSATMFSDMGSKMSVMAESLDILFDQPGIIDYAIDCSDAYDIFKNTLTIPEVWNTISQPDIDKILKKIPDLLAVENILKYYTNLYDFKIYYDGLSSADFKYTECIYHPNNETYTVTKNETSWSIKYRSRGSGSEQTKIFLYYPYPLNFTGVNKIQSLFSVDLWTYKWGVFFALAESLDDFENDRATLYGKDNESSADISSVNGTYYIAVVLSGKMPANQTFTLTLNRLYLTK